MTSPSSNRSDSESTPLLGQPATAAAPRRSLETLGLIFMTMSALTFSVMSLFVKINGSSFPSFEIVFARSFVQAILALIACAFLKVNPLGRRDLRGWLALRGFLGSLGLAFLFYSLTQLPLADATVMFFLNPTFTAILAAILLKEPFTLLDGTCAAFCMIGAILVSKPEFIFGHSESHKPLRLLPVLSAIVGGLIAASAYVTVRKLGKSAHFLVHCFYFGAISAVMSPILAVLFGQSFIVPDSTWNWFALLITGITAFIGQCFLNTGLQLAPAGPATLMRMNDIVFAFLFGIFILGEWPDLYSILGAIIITIMTSVMGLHKYFLSRR